MSPARRRTLKKCCRTPLGRRPARLEKRRFSSAARMQRLESEKVPVLTVDDTKAELGGALGFAGCAACAVTDLGLASAIVKKLAAEGDTRAAEVSGTLSARSEKAQRRRADTRKLGKKSKRKKQ